MDFAQRPLRGDLKIFIVGGRFVNIFFYFKNYSLNLERSYGGGFTLHNMLRPIRSLIIKPITLWNLFTNLGTNLSRKKDKFCKKRSR